MDKKIMFYKKVGGFILTLVIFLGFVLVFANLANAQVEWEPLVKIPGMPTGKAPLGGYLVSLYNFLLAAVGIIAMAMIVYGGFRYMTSAGNPATMAEAKDIVYSAIIGLALALLSWIIVATINPELLFTTKPGMPTANLPPTNIGANVPRSCAYGSLEGFVSPEPPDECRCTGDPKESQNPEDVDLDEDCEFSKSALGLTGTCDSLCKNSICSGQPECCLHAELRASEYLEGIGDPGWGTNTELYIKKGTTVYFDARDYSYNCKKPTEDGIALYVIDNSDIAGFGDLFGLKPDWICINHLVWGWNPCSGHIILMGFLSGFSYGFFGPWSPIWDPGSIPEKDQCGYAKYKFDNLGNFTVTLKIWDENCAVESKTDTILIYVSE